MSEYAILLPSKPRVVSEEEDKGVYEIDGLYPGYGHTLGNSLRRIILSSLPGASITSIKIEGVPHEFSVINGVKEDVVTMILNLKRIRFKLISDGPEKATISIKGAKKVTAKSIEVPGQIEVLNDDQYICETTSKTASLNIELTIEKGLGFVSKESLQKNKVEVGTIAVDAIFTPIRRVAYEVENMRVGDKTNHNRLKIFIQTDGTLTPREALTQSTEIMYAQIKAILDIKEEEPAPEIFTAQEKTSEASDKEDLTDALKTRVDTLDLSTRTQNALAGANIRTIGGLARKKVEDLLELDGIGDKGINEIKKALANLGISLKE